MPAIMPLCGTVKKAQNIAQNIAIFSPRFLAFRSSLLVVHPQGASQIRRFRRLHAPRPAFSRHRRAQNVDLS